MCWTPPHANKYKRRKQDMNPATTTRGKNEPNIVSMRTSQRTSQHETQNTKLHNRTTQKTKKVSNTDLTEKPGMNVGASEM